MGEVRVTARLTNAFDESLFRHGMLTSDRVRSHEADAVVDTVPVRTVLREVADRLGLAPRGQRVVYLAGGGTEAVSVTELLAVEIDGRDTLDEALVLGDEVLIGHPDGPGTRQ